MSFSDIFKTIFDFLGNDWMQTITGILYAGGGAGVIASFIKLKNLHKGSDVESKTAIANTDTNISKIKTSQTNIETKVDSNSKEIGNLTMAVTCLGDIIASVFLSSKAVPEDTKKAISKSVSILMDLGLDLKATSSITEGISKAVEIAKEVVDAVMEEQQITAEESKATAEATEEKSYEIYNKILEETNEQ